MSFLAGGIKVAARSAPRADGVMSDHATSTARRHRHAQPLKGREL
jgi:hypothetical protein